MNKSEFTRAYADKLRVTIKEAEKNLALFIETLTDYFVYPHTLTFKGDKDYPFAEEFIDNLCNKDNAKKYVLGKDLCECIDTPNYLGVLQTLIEKTPIIFE